MAGFEVMGGRYFNCGRHALVASYWGLFPNRESVDVGDGDGVRSAIFLPWATPADHETGEVQLYEDGAPDHRDVYYLYDQADFHRLRRYSNFHNVEINLLGFGVRCPQLQSARGLRDVSVREAIAGIGQATEPVADLESVARVRTIAGHAIRPQPLRHRSLRLCCAALWITTQSDLAGGLPLLPFLGQLGILGLGRARFGWAAELRRQYTQ